MKYHCEPFTNNKSKVTLIPENSVDQNLLKILDIDNPEHEFTFHEHYQAGLKKCNASAQLVGIDEFIKYPNIAICNFELAVGF